MPSRAPAVAAGCPADVAPDPHRCFHCGERNPRGSPWRLDVDGSVATFCCAGCLAVAQTIDAAGLTAFYQRRALATVPCNADDDDFVRAGEAATAGGLIVPVDEGRCDVALLLEGLRCGACVWLLETWLARQPGICEASVNFATRRARVRFDPAARMSRRSAARDRCASATVRIRTIRSGARRSRGAKAAALLLRMAPRAARQ